METVDVIIRLPKEYKDYIKCRSGIIPDKIIQYLFNALDNGTVLQKGHGKIIDESTITEVYVNRTEPEEINGIQTYSRIEIIGTNAPPIIKADTESEDKR